MKLTKKEVQDLIDKGEYMQVIAIYSGYDDLKPNLEDRPTLITDVFPNFYEIMRNTEAHSLTMLLDYFDDLKTHQFSCWNDNPALLEKCQEFIRNVKQHKGLSFLDE